MDRYASWFSMGCASAVATKIAISEGYDVDVLNIEIKEEHPDNERFMKDCEEWFGQKITVLGNDKFNRSIYEVYKTQRYIAGIAGASCTRLLKKDVRKEWEKQNPNHIQIFGFTVEERHRLDRLIDANNDIQYISPLIEKGLTKQDCIALINEAGIELPVLYTQGFKNNNCLGCCKGGVGYWLLIKKHYREMFDRMNQMEKMLNVKLLKYTENGETHRIRLDQIPPHFEAQDDSLDVQCGIFCELTRQEIGD